MDTSIVDYLMLEDVNPETDVNSSVVTEGNNDISTLERIKDRLQDDTQRSMMEKIINSARTNNTEIPKVINLVEAPIIPQEPIKQVTQRGLQDTPEQSKAIAQSKVVDLTKDSTTPFQNTVKEVMTTEAVGVDTINHKNQFVRKAIDFNALDELYLEEAQAFVQRYREEHPIKEDYPKRLEESFVEKVLSIPLQNEIRPTAVCEVPFLELEALGLPEDKVLSMINKELSEDALFSFITMNPYDSELGDFVYTENTVEIMSSDILCAI